MVMSWVKYNYLEEEVECTHSSECSDILQDNVLASPELNESLIFFVFKSNIVQEEG